MSAIGLLCAGLSAVFNGSFGGLSKVKRVQDVHLDPMVFMLYTCVGTCLSSFLVIPFLGEAYNYNDEDTTYAGSDHFVFTLYGLIAGSLLVGAFAFSFLAIPLAGLGIGQGIWAGSAIFVSFVWGVVAFPDDNKIGSPTLVVFALLFLTVGVVGIAFCRPISTLRFLQGPRPKEVEIFESFLDSGDASVMDVMVERENKRRGVVFALLVGLFGGSILVPMGFCPEKYQGLTFVPSFGIGTLAAGLVAFLLYKFTRGETVSLHPRECFLPGLSAGVIWNLGNICSVIGTQAVGLAVAFPILQCALFVSGLWGIFVFREIREKPAIVVFFASGSVLITGAVLLALSVDS
eukprot:Rmarinus@m.18117